MQHGNRSFNQLPSALTPLKSKRRWVNWRLEVRKGKKTKVPYQPSGVAAATDNEKTWSTFEAVAQFNGHDWNGIGFCLKDSEIAAFDIDNCLEPSTGRVHPWAMRLIERAGSYVEITPSGKGLRIIGYGRGAHLHCKRPVMDKVSCEIYRKATRYITISGVAFNDKPLVDIDAVMDATWAELDSKGKGGTDKEGRNENDDAIPNYLASLLYVRGTGAYETRSELLFAFITGTLRARVSNTEIIKACTDTTYIGCGIYEHVKENGGKPYLERQIEHARAKIKADLDDRVAKVNEDHALVLAGNKAVVMKFEKIKGKSQFRLLQVGSFKQWFANQQVTVGKKVMTIAEYWLNHSQRRQYHGIEFNPANNNCDDGYYNLWQGFAAEPRAGDYSWRTLRTLLPEATRNTSSGSWRGGPRSFSNPP
jgi:hypothetical protein